jgi:hypothetical protein
MNGTDSDVRHDKLDVIRKLLAKADRAATTEEAAAYNDKAMQLMAQHGIDEALLAASGEVKDEIGSRRIAMDDPYSAGKARLLSWTAGALRCKAILHETSGGKVAAVTIFGYTSDMDRVELLYTSLLLQATHQLTRVRPVDDRDEWERRYYGAKSVSAYRRSWLHGFAVEVHARLSRAEEVAATTTVAQGGSSTPGTAMVLVSRTEAVEQAYKQAFPRVRQARRVSMNGSGFSDGAEAGARADLGGKRVGGSRRALA